MCGAAKEKIHHAQKRRECFCSVVLTVSVHFMDLHGYDVVLRGSVETATINYRVADFLKRHPPFPAMDEGDLLSLAGRGRVKFFEANEYIVVQGDPYSLQVLVIQQGTVTLWDESGGKAELRD